jgi:hypothetical protein
MGRKVPKGDLTMSGPSDNVPVTTLVAFGPGRHDRAAALSESVDSIVSFSQLSLLVFGRCFWLSFDRTVSRDPKKSIFSNELRLGFAAFSVGQCAN